MRSNVLKFLLLLLFVPFLISPAFAAEYEQTTTTSEGTLDIGIYTIPEIPNIDELTKLKIDFLKTGTQKVQEHVDYRIAVIKDDQNVFGPIRLTHTSTGSVTIPVQFTENGEHKIQFEVEGILFMPIPLETAEFSITIGQQVTPVVTIPDWVRNNAAWWAEGAISDNDFASGIEFMIKEGIIIVPVTESGQKSDAVIPDWVKNNAAWWAEGQIDDQTFANGLQFLIKVGIITV